MSGTKEVSIAKGVLLVAGTAIGGGMLALPVLTSTTGFWPSLFIYMLCWLFMTCTGLLLLEVCTWVETESNLVTMADRTLGRFGKSSAWLLYLFLFYCLTLAYIVGCAGLFVELFQGKIPEWLGAIFVVAVFAPIVIAGARFMGTINAVLMVGLIISYLAFVFLGYDQIDPQLLTFRDWSTASLALPIAFTSFAYQGIIPTLYGYMHHNIVRTRTVIIIGSFLPFIVYAIWQALILGIVPIDGPGGLAEALENGENAVQPLKNFLDNPHVYTIGRFFAFFALITSFMGVTLGLTDFLADGLQIKKTATGKILLSLLVYIPPLLLAFTFPGVFLTALDYAGGFGCALLLGLLPILMVWSGRYHLGISTAHALPGGRILLLLLIIFVVFEVYTQINIVISGY